MLRRYTRCPGCGSPASAGPRTRETVLLIWDNRNRSWHIECTKKVLDDFPPQQPALQGVLERDTETWVPCADCGQSMRIGSWHQCSLFKREGAANG